jgi:hypothetical protein
VGTAFSGLGAVLTLLEKEIELREKLDTKYGLDTGKGTNEGLPPKT